jgi:hypothetical protein
MTDHQATVEPSEKPGFIFCPKSYMLAVLREQCEAQQVPWIVVEKSIIAIVDGMYSEGWMLSKAEGSNPEKLKAIWAKTDKNVQVYVNLKEQNAGSAAPKPAPAGSSGPQPNV